MGGFQQCKDWGSGGQFKVCEIQCNSGLKFSQPVPKFYTCGAEGFWRPTENPALPLVYPACSGEFINNTHLVLTIYVNICFEHLTDRHSSQNVEKDISV